MRSIRKIATYNIPKLWYTFLAIINSIFCRKGRIAICCIAKNENLYIREWVEYHKVLGIDHITIYDNNDPNGEKFDEVIEDYIISGFCRIINYRGKQLCQLDAYNHFYTNNKDTYDWIAFIDCDEFMTIGKNIKGSIKSALNNIRYIPYQMIHVNWMNYGDNNLVDYDNRPILSRFSIPTLPYDFKWYYDFPDNNHTKTIVRGGLRKVTFIHTHYCASPYYYCCNDKGTKVNMESPFSAYDFDYIYIRHFRTKTIGEYIKKIQRGGADMTMDEYKTKFRIDDFFVVNERTPEKESYIQNILNSQC